MGSPLRFPSSLKAFLRRLSSAAARGGGGEGSAAYRQSMLRPPATVRPESVPRNSCSLIGTVAGPVKPFAKSGYWGSVYTFLDIGRSLRDSSSSVRVLLAMRGEVAEISVRHLKPNDLIYVHGSLGSYEKVGTSGNREIFHKVFVKDMNYVKCNEQYQTPQSSMGDRSTGPATGAVDHENEYVDRLRLWQIFFANPYEWWDNRQGKRNSRKPDFRHKDTGECLWLKPDDPPWVRKQLQLYDSKVAGIYREKDGGLSELHEWKIGDL